MVLDATCGSRMIWFDKDNKNTIYADNRVLDTVLCDGRILNITPDFIYDFRSMPFEKNTFHLVVFDPPHLVKVGQKSWLFQKYGSLADDWKLDLKSGVDECMRVLKPYGTLIFKWNEEQIQLSEILSAIKREPLFGNRRSKTHWIVFIKEVSHDI